MMIKNKKILILIFFIAVMLQLVVPAKMILDLENVIEHGIVCKFKTIPIDPNDPFRGKFIRLNFKNAQVKKQTGWEKGQNIYVNFTLDQEGYAQIQTSSKTKPTEGNLYVKAKLGYIRKGIDNVDIEYPFDRFYMKESKAQKAEDIYRENSRIDTIETYALIKILGGEAVLLDVLSNGKSLTEQNRIE